MLIFAVGLVTAPGVLFALLAFSGACDALKREVGIQLHQTAELGADAVAAALQTAQGDPRSWARQDVMRDLVDVDSASRRFCKRCETTSPLTWKPFASTGKASSSQPAAVRGSRAQSPKRGFGRGAGEAREVLPGPAVSPEIGREVVLLGVPIEKPDKPGGRIGSLFLIYDWDGVRALLDGIRVKLAVLGKRVAAIVVDRQGRVIGGASFDSQAAERSAVAGDTWADSAPDGWGERDAAQADGVRTSVLVGRALVANPPSDGR